MAAAAAAAAARWADGAAAAGGRRLHEADCTPDAQVGAEGVGEAVHSAIPAPSRLCWSRMQCSPEPHLPTHPLSIIMKPRASSTHTPLEQHHAAQSLIYPHTP